jgi:Lipopolysaccharide biosynthesis proteins, LPS:glycosyltransferases
MKTINILVPVDMNYFVSALTAMTSLVVSNDGRDKIVFHYAWEKADDNVQNVITKAMSRFPNVEIIFYRLDLSFLKNHKQISYAPPSLMPYARLLAGRFLPASVERILYLDSDILVMRDVSELFDIDMKGKAVMAAPGHYQYKQTPYAVGVPFYSPAPSDDATYFNAGVLLIDMNQWRIYQSKFEEVLHSFDPRLLVHLDQTVLNYVLINKIGRLDRCWNFWADHCRAEPDSILHFIGPDKPWKANGTGRAVKLWRIFFKRHVECFLPKHCKAEFESKWKEITPVRPRPPLKKRPLRPALSMISPRLLNEILGLLSPGRTVERKAADLENLKKKRQEFIPKNNARASDSFAVKIRLWFRWRLAILRMFLTRKQ